MLPEEILSYPARVLTQKQRHNYFNRGYLIVEKLIPINILKKIKKVTSEFVEMSKEVTASNERFDVSPEHTKEKPILRRIKMPDGAHPEYWDFSNGIIADVASDLLGPNVVFHHSKLNFKWYDESDKVKWHQDIQFFPHTNYNVITIGCYLEDTDMKNGPLAVLEGSHNQKLYDQYDKNGNWTGMLSDDDAKKLDKNKIKFLTGKAGSITIHNARTLHFSPSSKSPLPRPLLLNCFTSADAKPYMDHYAVTENTYKIVRGKKVKWAHHDPRPCQIPPDWANMGGYSSIYSAQSGQDKND